MGEFRDVIYQFDMTQNESTKFHTLMKACQALRIMVNQEIDNIKKLFDALPVLCRGNETSLAIMIGFHELEFDAIVAGKKRLRQTYKMDDYTKGQAPTQEEISANSPSKSAKLYAWEFKPKDPDLKKVSKNTRQSVIQNMLS